MTGRTSQTVRTLLARCRRAVERGIGHELPAPFRKVFEAEWFGYLSSTGHEDTGPSALSLPGCERQTEIGFGCIPLFGYAAGF